MKKTIKSVAFSGHRQVKLPKNKEKMESLLANLEQAILEARKQGYDTFYTGLCNGFDLIAAEKVLALQDKSVKLIGVVPHLGQEAEWPEEEQEEYRKIRDGCHELVVLNEKKIKGCYYQRNRFMVDHSSLLICYCSTKSGGTAYTVQYAGEIGVEVINLHQKKSPTS
ncbi:MAG: SLOG family protein [Eubacteriales bacterium]